MGGMQPAGRDPVVNGPMSKPESVKLRPRDHPVLVAGQGGDRPIRPRFPSRAAFGSYVMPNVAFGGTSVPHDRSLGREHSRH